MVDYYTGSTNIYWGSLYTSEVTYGSVTVTDAGSVTITTPTVQTYTTTTIKYPVIKKRKR
jgi:hypothetical protein